MNHTLHNMEEILNQHISGFHQYILDAPVHLCYVSRNLCGMVSYEAAELLDDRQDRYSLLVHPADREKYAGLLRDLSAQAQTRTAEYRLIKRDGTVLWVRDTAVSEQQADGTMTACSVLTDISDLKKEQDPLQFLNETIPCGFLRYTCEKQPQITYINQTMMDLLRFSGPDDLEMYKSNIFLLIPMEERRRFSLYLERVYTADAPIAGEMTVFRCDGTRAILFGWVTRCINAQGVPEFQSVCMDITERHKARQKTAETRYLQALSEVYDKIFAFNTASGTVKCLHCEDASSFKRFENIAIQLDDAIDKWIIGSVVESDRDRVGAFFRAFSQKKMHPQENAPPPQISYKARASDGGVKPYNGIFIKVDDTTSFYCCRNVTDLLTAEQLKKENNLLKESMKHIATRFDGLAAFEISPEGLVKPLYASENVSAFFGYTDEEWQKLMAKPAPFDNFVAYSEAAYDEFTELLKNGEAEFTYFDYQTESERKIKAICSQKDPDSNAPRYVMLYSVKDDTPDEKVRPVEHRAVSIRTFGYFDVFVDGKPIPFRNEKSKELLALLVDRKGGYVSSEDAIGFLWEDEPASPLTLARYRKVALRLKNTLEDYGIADVVESVDGKRRLVMEKVQCDLYQYLSGKAEYAQLFKGSYLTNYSWGEITLGELLGDAEF